MGFDVLLHPQITRVHAINQRLRVADTLARNPETAPMAHDVVRTIRRDIIAHRPHRVDQLLPLRAYFEPSAVAAQWRREINGKLALIAALAKHVGV